MFYCPVAASQPGQLRVVVAPPALDELLGNGAADAPGADPGPAFFDGPARVAGVAQAVTEPTLGCELASGGRRARQRRNVDDTAPRIKPVPGGVATPH
ncbi:hypothetical protein DL770_005861 [Monosporascus sp. CRB-9-2]|nr:hypothetical protein DL770_005861 [Monosporascus sp. CRB-9-2]